MHHSLLSLLIMALLLASCGGGDDEAPTSDALDDTTLVDTSDGDTAEALEVTMPPVGTTTTTLGTTPESAASVTAMGITTGAMVQVIGEEDAASFISTGQPLTRGLVAGCPNIDVKPLQGTATLDYDVAACTDAAHPATGTIVITRTEDGDTIENVVELTDEFTLGGADIDGFVTLTKTGDSTEGTFDAYTSDSEGTADTDAPLTITRVLGEADTEVVTTLTFDGTLVLATGSWSLTFQGGQAVSTSSDVVTSALAVDVTELTFARPMDESGCTCPESGEATIDGTLTLVLTFQNETLDELLTKAIKVVGLSPDEPPVLLEAPVTCEAQAGATLSFVAPCGTAPSVQVDTDATCSVTKDDLLAAIEGLLDERGYGDAKAQILSKVVAVSGGAVDVDSFLATLETTVDATVVGEGIAEGLEAAITDGDLCQAP